MEGARLNRLRHSMSPRHPANDLRPDDSSDEEELDEEELDRFIGDHDAPSGHTARYRLFTSFLLFGLLNNVDILVLYVIILSAALDLVPPTTPKGVVALFNILPALLTKVLWPILSSGTIQYKRRVLFCTACSWLGIITIAFSTGLYGRLLGISLASLSSGLGELTFLQLTTTLPTRSSSKTALGAWSSGTGAAGIAGAGIWWLLRGLGVKGGLGISSILPLFFPVTYFFLLPKFSIFVESSKGVYESIPTLLDPDTEVTSSIRVTLPSTEDEEMGSGRLGKRGQVYLTTKEKVDLVKPLVLRFMLPLFAVYVEEYVINSGVAPTLVFPLPTSGPWSRLFKSSRDYYPFWSLTYQSFVFLSRSSLSLGLPAIPRHLLPLPSIIQFFVLLLLSLQSCRFIFSSETYTPPNTPPSTGVDRSITFVFLLICLEGLCGGSAYVNTFWHVGREGIEGESGNDQSEQGEKKEKMEKEFRIGAVGAADSCGILFASLISMPTEVALCNAQVAAGRTTCRDL